ncbi:class E sortase [Actinosynnema sp. CS-041913]|uniref:class E sortase n=1 Tax=Actinosynnema sp. CS-041913 TaxID=3239917 RepID=UPI003D8E17AD
MAPPAPSAAPADATRYTNAFSGSLPPPPASPQAGPLRTARPRPRPVDPPTEIIEPVEDEYVDDYDDYDDDYVDDYDDDPPPPPDSTARKTVRTVGELLITAGLVILLFVVYEVYVTDLISAGKQDDATSALDEQWNANTVEPADPQRELKYDLIEGQAFAKMYIPVFGPDYKFSVVEGTTDKHLEIGPGHYVNTALPGNPGNFAVAGHRVGKGAPFNDLDLLNSCDAIIVETQTHWFVYRMLPKAGEVAGWAQNEKSKSKQCAKVSPLGGSYDKTVGQEIVLPTQGEVINEVPHFTGAAPPEAQQVALMTLTTCHPRFSDKQRLIVHAVLDQGYPKAPGFVPEELKEQ